MSSSLMTGLAAGGRCVAVRESAGGRRLPDLRISVSLEPACNGTMEEGTLLVEHRCLAALSVSA